MSILKLNFDENVYSYKNNDFSSNFFNYFVVIQKIFNQQRLKMLRICTAVVMNINNNNNNENIIL